VERGHIRDELIALFTNGIGYEDLWRMVATIRPETRSKDWASTNSHAWKLFEKDELKRSRGQKALITHERVARAIKGLSEYFLLDMHSTTDGVADREKIILDKRIADKQADEAAEMAQRRREREEKDAAEDAMGKKIREEVYQEPLNENEGQKRLDTTDRLLIEPPEWPRSRPTMPTPLLQEPPLEHGRYVVVNSRAEVFLPGCQLSVQVIWRQT
jgi:hypothetical protein